MLEAILKVVETIVMGAFFEVVEIVTKVVVAALHLVIGIQHDVWHSIRTAFVLGLGGTRAGFVAWSFFHHRRRDLRSCGGDGCLGILICNNGDLVGLCVFFSFIVRFGAGDFSVRRFVVDFLDSRRGNRRSSIRAHWAGLRICELVLFVVG